MTDLMAAPVAPWLARKGAILRTSTPVRAIRYKPAGFGRITGVIARRRRFPEAAGADPRRRPDKSPVRAS